MKLAGRWIGPIIVAASAAAMLSWSWGTWPDPLVDYGMNLYIPWQIAGGKVLYRDIAYYNGPLSSYLNAGIFRMFGPSLHVLEATNLLILAAVMILIYRLTVRASGRIAAVFGGLTFALIFAFGQQLELGNYNWVTPYVHEITHGIALGLVCIACVDRFARKGNRIWLVAGGVAAGAALLTKAEPAAATVAAATAQIAAVFWMRQPNRKSAAKSLACFFLPLALLPLAAMGLLATHMPLSLAARGTAGSWMWVLDRRITDLPFYRMVAGLDDVRGHLITMTRWSAGYTVFLGAGIGLSFLLRRRAWFVSALVFLLTAGLFAWQFSDIDWTSMLTPLPVCLAVIGVISLVAVLRRRGEPPATALRLALVVFSVLLLAKISLSAHAFHYGFALALPGTLILVAVVGENLPAWIEAHGGNGGVLRAMAAAAWLAGTVATLRIDRHYFDQKQWEIAADTGDSFRGSVRGLEVQRMCDIIEQRTAPGDTLAVFPQGLMLNYLTRRPQSTRFVNFMPPEVIAASESSVITALQKNPPDAIVVDIGMVRGEQFDLDGVYDFGAATLKWISDNYVRIDGTDRFAFLTRKQGSTAHGDVPAPRSQ